MVNFNTDYDSLIGRHKEKPAIIVGGSKGIERFPFNDFDGLVFSMGDIPLRAKYLFKTNYWVFANCDWVRPWVKRDADGINSLNVDEVFFATVAFAKQEEDQVLELINKSYELLNKNIFIYDQRHLKKNNCQKKQACCLAFNEFKIQETIQESIQKKFNIDQVYSQGGTVAIHTLALALLMGCCPIYIIGVDIPTLKKDYTYFQDKRTNKNLRKYGALGPFNEKEHYLDYRNLLKRIIPDNLYSALSELKNPKSDSVFKQDLTDILDDFNYLGNLYLRVNGSKIINFNENSSLKNLKSYETSSINNFFSI